jgi:hypothetical protein
VEAAVESRHDLIHWVFDIHNDVNEQLGKRRISFQEYVKYMQALAAAPNTKLPSSSSGPDVKTVALTVAAVALVAGVGYYYKQK